MNARRQLAKLVPALHIGVLAATVSAQPYAPTILGDNPVAYYRLGEAPGSSIAVDASPNKINGTYSGSVTLGLPGLATADNTSMLTGPSGLVLIPNDGKLNFVGLPFSIEAWVSFAELPITGRRVFDKAQAGTPMGYGMDIATTEVRLFGSSNLQAPFSPQLNTPYHVVGVSNGSGMASIYVNGALIKSGPYTSDNPYTGAAHIGVANDGTAHLNGTIDEVAVYNYALSASKVLAHYNARGNSSPCGGAIDVTSKVDVLRGPFLGVPPLFHVYAQTIKLINQSSDSIPGPIYLVFEGLPRTDQGLCPNTCSVEQAPVTTCGSPAGSAIVLVSQTGMSPHQIVQMRNVLFGPAKPSGSPYSKFAYIPRVLSGEPIK